VPKHAVGIRTASFGLLAIFLAMLALSIWRTRWKGRLRSVLDGGRASPQVPAGVPAGQ